MTDNQNIRSLVSMPTTLNETARTVEVVFATTTPVKRYDPYSNDYYWEVLSMDPAAVDLTRLNAGAPVLKDHNTDTIDNVIGVVLNARVEGDQLVGTIRLSSDIEASKYFDKIKEGVLKNFSIGYSIEKLTETGKRDGYRVVEVSKWAPYELSIVTVPADPNAQYRNKTKENHMEEQEIKEQEVLNQEDVSEDNNLIEETSEVLAQEEVKEEVAEPVVEEEVVEEPAPVEEKVEEVVAEEVAIEAPVEEDIHNLPSRTWSPEDFITLQKAATRSGMASEAFESLLKESASQDDVRSRIIEFAASNSAASDINTLRKEETMNIHFGDSQQDKQVRAFTEGLLSNIKLDSKTYAAQAENDNPYGNKSLVKMGRQFLVEMASSELEKQRIMGMEDIQVAQRMLASGDFTSILADVQNKAMGMAYQYNESVLAPLFTRKLVKDFRANYYYRASGFEAFSLANDVVQEGNYHPNRGSMTTSEKTYRLDKTYMKKYMITREAIINDDLGAFNEIPASVARQVRILEDKLLINALTGMTFSGNGDIAASSTTYKWGPAAASESASEAAWQAYIAKAMKNMKDFTDLNGDRIDLTPNYLLVPHTLEAHALKYIYGDFMPSLMAGVNNAAGFRGLNLIVAPRLEDTGRTYAAYEHYLMAGAAQADNLFLMNLASAPAPQIDAAGMNHIAGVGMEMTVLYDVAVAAMETTGIVRGDAH